jgi:hypothetical protein
VEEDIAAIKEDITANKKQMEQVKAIAERGSRPTVSANTAQAPTFDRKTSWSTFRRQFENVAEHNMWSDREKSRFLIKALKGRAADVLAGIAINTPYEDNLQTLEDRFGDQHFATAYRCQLATRQKDGESLQEFATAIELLAHRAYPTLPEDHIGREAAKAFAHGVDDPDIKIQLLLGGEKTINEALRQAIELQAVLVAASPQNSNTGPYRGELVTPTRRRYAKEYGCWNCGQPGHFGINCPHGRHNDNKWQQRGKYTGITTTVRMATKNQRRKKREGWPIVGKAAKVG